MPQSRLYTDAFSPADALQLLREGNFRFINGMMQHRDLLEEVTHTTAGQRPFAAIVSCMDSRTSGELVFDQGLGDIFSIRIAGNIITSFVLGSLEYACELAGAQLIVVMGHTHCGAIKGACDGVVMGHLTGLLTHIHPALMQAKRTVEGIHSGQNPEFVSAVTTQNILNATAQIRVQSDILKDRVLAGKLIIVPACYDVATGQVVWL
ncbi:MAG: carbonic anhydrase [Bacteroidetes bacterium]|nr:carbonic anhydrase [Bacteroidota bacterium]